MINYRKICDKERLDVKVPVLPLTVAINNEVYESDSIRGLMCSVLGSQYEDNEDEKDDWNSRLIYARKIAMQMIQYNMDITIVDKNIGIIPNNYAAAFDDEDYMSDEDNYEKKEIEISTEKEFLKSLLKLNLITIYERNGSNQFLESDVSCKECSHGVSGICKVYNSKVDKIEGCDSGTKYNVDKGDRDSEYILVRII